MFEFLHELSPGYRVIGILLIAVVGHFLVQGLRRLTTYILTPKEKDEGPVREVFAKRYPKTATIFVLVVSTLTFIIYFVAVGLILDEFNISLTAYFATATVIGLAVGFGLQGLVQDVVIGLTLVFSDIIDINDVVEVSGQIGRVERIGMRFTVIVNFHGQRVFVPNRNIGMVNRFRGGAIRAYVDVQVPEDTDEKKMKDALQSIASAMRAQHSSIILNDPEIFGIQRAGSGGWRYVRVKFRLWPGQGTLIENTYRQRVIQTMKELTPTFNDHMITVTYRVD